MTWSMAFDLQPDQDVFEAARASTTSEVLGGALEAQEQVRVALVAADGLLSPLREQERPIRVTVSGYQSAQATSVTATVSPAMPAGLGDSG